VTECDRHGLAAERWPGPQTAANCPYRLIGTIVGYFLFVTKCVCQIYVIFITSVLLYAYDSDCAGTPDVRERMDYPADQADRTRVPPATWVVAEDSTRPVLPSPSTDRDFLPPGRHRARVSPLSRAGLRQLFGKHGTRFVSFSVVGAFVFVLGLGIQAFLVQVWGVGSIPSFLIQGFISVEVSFVLNYYWTWRDREIRFWPACYKFNTQKIITTVFNLLIYAGLVALHVNYLVANVATTVIFTAINYLVGNFWAFVPAKGKNNCPPPSV
jgi:putative flippase GtrA